MLDKNGYRPNVGIILLNRHNQVFWGKRIREQAWQFPQGGINPGETPEQAMYRELYEEVGLQTQHVKVLGRTRDWLRYDVPNRWVRREWRGHYRGQKQIWFLLRLLGSEENIALDATRQPEFDAWRWSEYWVPLDDVIDFKRAVYQKALLELVKLLKAPPKRPPDHGLLLSSKTPRTSKAAGQPGPKAPAAKPGSSAPPRRTEAKAAPGARSGMAAGGATTPKPKAASTGKAAPAGMAVPASAPGSSPAKNAAAKSTAPGKSPAAKPSESRPARATAAQPGARPPGGRGKRGPPSPSKTS